MKVTEVFMLCTGEVLFLDEIVMEKAHIICYYAHPLRYYPASSIITFEVLLELKTNYPFNMVSHMQANLYGTLKSESGPYEHALNHRGQYIFLLEVPLSVKRNKFWYHSVAIAIVLSTQLMLGHTMCY